MKLVGFFPGTFDPLTYGHLDVIRRSLKFVDYLFVGIGINIAKRPLLSVKNRFNLLNESTKTVFNDQILGSVVVYNGLMIREASERGAKLIIRGIRNQADYAYEFQVALVNHVIAGDIQTVFLPSSAERTIVSSSLVREMIFMNEDISQFVPDNVSRLIKNLRQQKRRIINK